MVKTTTCGGLGGRRKLFLCHDHKPPCQSEGILTEGIHIWNPPKTWKEKKGGRYSLNFLLIELVKTVNVENVLLIMYAFYSIFTWVLRCGFISLTNRKMKGLHKA